MTLPDDLTLGDELEQAEAAARLATYFPLAPVQLLDSRRQVAALLLPDNQIRPFVGRALGLGLGLGRPVEARTLEQVVAYYENLGADAALLAIPPTARPSSLPRMLEALGFRAGFREARLYRQTNHQPPPDTFALIRLATIDDIPELTALLVASGVAPDLSQFLMSSIGRDGWRHYIAHENGAAVALAGMFIHLRTAWFIPGLTDRAHRRRGYQRALTSHRIAEAQRQGCTRVTTNISINEAETPGLSFRSLSRLGFQLLYLRTTYLWQPPGRPPLDLRGR